VPDDDAADALAAPVRDSGGERSRFVALMRAALAAALALLTPKDRLRVGCYYAQGMKLAQVGRLLGESEATASRQLARVRAELRRHVDAHLRERDGLDEESIHECWTAVTDDPGPIDLGRLLAGVGGTAEAARMPSTPVQGEEDSRDRLA
jgi:hypothetical protein